jgi:trigger factor
LENSRKSEAEQKADNALMDAFCEKVEVEIPDVLVDEEVQNEINQLASQIQQYGMNLNQYLSMMGKKPEDLKAEYHDNAEKTVKIRLGLEAVAKAEDLKPTEEEINTEYDNIAKQYNMDAAKVKSMIDPELLKKDLCNQKAYDFVKENASKTAAEKKPAKKPAAKKAAKKDAE